MLDLRFTPIMSNQIETIYIDEAGNTGQDLLNNDQKVFILASNNFLENEIEELLSLFERKEELHFVKLKNSSPGRSQIIQLLNHPLITEDHVQGFTADKAYVATGHIVDRLIEPVYYDRGIDLYKGGKNIIILNYIYHFGEGGIWDLSIFRRFLNLFISMVRKKGEDEIEQFYQSAKELYDSPKTNERALLKPVIESREQIQEILSHIDKFTLDVTLAGFYNLCDLWHKRTGNKLRIFQDNSKQIDFYREHIEFTANLNIEKQDIGYDSRKMIYPTQIEKLSLVSSATHPGIQISDILASSLAFMYNSQSQKQDKFVKEIQNSRFVNLTNFHMIWPNQSVTPEALDMAQADGENPLDFLAMQMLKNKYQTD